MSTPETAALADILAQLKALKPVPSPSEAFAGRTLAHIASTLYAKEGVNTYIIKLVGMLATRHARLTQLILYEYTETGLVDVVEIGSSRIVFVSFMLNAPDHLLAMLQYYHQVQPIHLMAVQVPFFPEARAAADYARQHDLGFVAYNHAGPDGLSGDEERLFRETLTLHPRTRVLAVSAASRDKIVKESRLQVPVRVVGQMLSVENFTLLDPDDIDENLQASVLRNQLGVDDPDDILVLAPNSFIPRKMPMDLIHAVDLLVNEKGMRQIRLAFVGHTTFAKSIDLFQHALRHVQDHGLTEQVSFSEPVDHALLRLIYAAADIVVLPGRSETFGLVLAEAGLMQRPVIGYDMPGIREVVVHDETGLLVPWSDHDDIRIRRLATALETLCLDPARRTAMGLAGRRHVLASFDPGQSIHIHEAAYAEAMGLQ